MGRVDAAQQGQLAHVCVVPCCLGDGAEPVLGKQPNLVMTIDLENKTCAFPFFFWSAGEVDTPSHLQTKREQFGFDKYILKQFWHCEDLQCSAGWWWGLIQLYSPLLSQGHLKTRPGVTTSSCYELLATLQGFNTILREAILQVPKVRWLHHVRLCV